MRTDVLTWPIERLRLLCENTQSLPLKLRATLMLERQQSSTVTQGIAADAPVQGGGADQGVVPLAPTGAVAQYQSRARIRQPLALPVGLIVARLPLADMPQLLVR
jgi:hypothetical protein